MRLKPSQIQTLLDAIPICFGKNASIWLFGSRVDDHIRGGDYDFLIEADLNAEQLVRAKMKFLLEIRGDPDFEEEKIDIVITSPQLLNAPPIVAHAKQQGIRL